MIPFLPLLGWALGGFLGGLLVGWAVDYLTKQVVKKHIQEQKKQKFDKDLSKYIGELLENEGYNNHNFGLENMLPDNKNTISSHIKKMSKDLIIHNLIGKYDYKNRKALLETSLERLQEMLWMLEKNRQISEASYKSMEANEIDWILEDEESRKIFAGKYYNGEVVSMEEIKAKEIEPELQWELDNQEIVIL